MATPNNMPSGQNPNQMTCWIDRFFIGTKWTNLRPRINIRGANGTKILLEATHIEKKIYKVSEATVDADPYSMDLPFECEKSGLWKITVSIPSRGMQSTKFEFPIAAVSNTRTQIIDSMKKLEAYPLQLTSQTLSTILQDFTEREELRSFNTLEISFLSQHYESNPTFFWRWLIPRIKAISRSQDVGKNVNYFRELFSETYWLLIDKETAADLISDMGSGTVLFSTSRSDKDAILVSSIVEEDRVQHWKHLMTPLITPITALLDHLKDRWTMDQIRLFQYKTSATHSIADIISAINKRKAYGESTLHPVKVRRVSGRDDVSRSSAGDSESRRLSADYSGQLSPNSSWSESPSPFYDPHSISGETHMVEANSPNPMGFVEQPQNMNNTQQFNTQMYNPNPNQGQGGGMMAQNTFPGGNNQFQPGNAKQAPHMQGNPRLQQQRAFQEQLHQQPQMHNPFQQQPPHLQQPGGQQQHPGQFFQPIKEENPFDYHQYQMGNDMNAPFWGTNSANNSSETLNMNAVNQGQIQQQQNNQNPGQLNPNHPNYAWSIDILKQ
jgi:hypothetical protein